MELRFDERVAVVTGAGGGLGREHALLLAKRGALVVVNDLGSQVDGSGAAASAAEQVVEQIRALGGTAVADANSIATEQGAAALIERTRDEFGRVDIVVNNAGILRDRAFHKMSADEFQAVLDVHLTGSFHVTRAAWPHLREQGYGRVVMTTSAAGLLGNFGQANYGAAKAGLIGLANVLAIEGQKHNILVNTIAPVARTRMTQDLLGSLAERVDPALVAPVVAWLAHEDCPVSGHVYSVGGGRVARFFVGMTTGWTAVDHPLTVEDVRDHSDEIEDVTSMQVPTALADDFRALKHALSGGAG